MSVFANKRLVIFGCGHVGTAVALRAAAEGGRVVALTRNAASAVVLREQAIETVVADLASDDWHAAIPAPELVLNCVSSGGGGAAGYRHSYVDGMRSVMAWARRHGPVGTIVYTSSTSVYPQGGGVTVDETAPLDWSGGDDAARLLIAAEDALREAAGAAQRWFILRLAGIYGPGRHHLLEQVKSGEVSGSPETRLNLIHRDDIATAIEACFGAPPALANEVFNVVDGSPARKSEVVAWLAARLGAPVPRFSGTAGIRRRVTPDRIISNRKLCATFEWRPRFASYREGYSAILHDG